MTTDEYRYRHAVTAMRWRGGRDFWALVDFTGIGTGVSLEISEGTSVGHVYNLKSDVCVRPGEWLVRRSDGRFEVFSDEDFRAMFRARRRSAISISPWVPPVTTEQGAGTPNDGRKRPRRGSP